ncbi:helix-turn-helix domain-containing protein [Paenibacillus harenae]|uniref:helix-turn-helix domain-containing protein n=1 Tax=Paenibacillus harenae TaxID=306543 RepID=UPI000424D48F|nr:helix-turn-helix domain-containing protein [Paenibacillus harenae]
MIRKSKKTHSAGNKKTIHSSFFRKSLIMVLLITCMPTALLALSMYVVGVKQIESELNSSHQLQSEQTTKQIQEQLANLEVILAQWALNPVFGERLKTADFGWEVNDTRDLFKTLMILQQTNPLIEDVFVYIPSAQKLVSDSFGVDSIENPAVLKQLNQLTEGKYDIYWTDNLPTPLRPGESTQSDEFPYKLILRIAGGASEKYAALLLKVDKKQLVSYFNNPQGIGATIMFDQKGELLIHGDHGDDNNKEFDNLLKEAVSEHVAKSDSPVFILPYKDKRYSVSYGTYSRADMNWTFAMATDISKIFSPVILMTRIILIISVIGILTAIVLSWFASRRIHDPIARLMGAILSDKGSQPLEDADELKYIEREWKNLSSESRLLQNKLEEQLPSLRNGFLLQLSQGHLYYLSEAELRERMTYYGWETDNQVYTVLLIQLVGKREASEKFREGDEQLLSFAASNIIEDLVRIRLKQSHVINFQDMSVGVLVGLPSALPAKQLKEELVALSEEFTSMLSHILKQKTVVCIGYLSDEISRIPDMLEEAQRTIRYRNLTETDQVIDMEESQAEGDYRFHYPFGIEKDLIHAIRMGQTEEAFEKATAFVQELENRSGLEIYAQQAMIQLLGHIQHSLLHAGYSVYDFHEGQNLYEELSQLRQPQEMLKWFNNKIIEPYIGQINQSQQHRMKQMVDKALLLVEYRYMDDISLEECAELVGTTSPTLSKAFKQSTGVNFVDYMTKIRMDKSKEMLLNTDLKISDIAERVGYQPSWFNRVFKKHEGITPSQFRETHQR